MEDVYSEKGKAFVVIIDEWDAVFRERKNDKEGQTLYLDFLRDWMKDKQYIALAYMTGILPVKKYGKHSALNMFDEYSVMTPLQLAPYTGFTEDEVKELCEKYSVYYEDISNWYDGYVVNTDIPVEMREKYRAVINTATYQNDMTSFQCRDDLLTMLIHLGYFGYDADTKEVFIPNNEILDEFKNSTRSEEWTGTFTSFKKSQEL